MKKIKDKKNNLTFCFLVLDITARKWENAHHDRNCERYPFNA